MTLALVPRLKHYRPPDILFVTSVPAPAVGPGICIGTKTSRHLPGPRFAISQRVASGFPPWRKGRGMPGFQDHQSEHGPDGRTTRLRPCTQVRPVSLHESHSISSCLTRIPPSLSPVHTPRSSAPLSASVDIVRLSLHQPQSPRSELTRHLLKLLNHGVTGTRRYPRLFCRRHASRARVPIGKHRRPWTGIDRSRLIGVFMRS